MASPAAAVHSLQRICLLSIRRNMYQLESMCRSYTSSSAACQRIAASVSEPGAELDVRMSVPVPADLLQEILVAAAGSKLASSLRSLSRVNPMVSSDILFDPYWKQAVECDFAVRPIPGPFAESVDAFRHALQSLDTPSDAPTDRALLNMMNTYPFSVQLMKETGAGVALKRIAGQKTDGAVADQARKLCAKWRASYVALKGGPAATEAQAHQEAIRVGKIFEQLSGWREVYDSCEQLQGERERAVAVRLRERDEQDVTARHVATLIAAAPRHHSAKPSAAASAASARHAVSAGGYCGGRSIRQTLAAGKGSAAKQVAKRPVAPACSVRMLGKSTKAVQTVVTSSGGVMRVPRK